MSDESFRRVVGSRPRPEPGEPPTAAARRALARLAGPATGAPKGVFRYKTHEEANAHREAWTVDRLVAARSCRDANGP
jgi:hypothetical protein